MNKHGKYERLIAKGDKLRKEGQKGNPIFRHGQIRNECWNCKNYPEEKSTYGAKGYYKCSYCGATMHK